MNYHVKPIVYFLLLLTALFCILIVPSLLPVQSQTEKQNNVQHNDARSQRETVATIFNNNMLIAGLTLIPGLGWATIFFILWNTGKVVASYNQPWYWSFNNLFAWIELSVYSYALLKSIKLIHLWRQRKTKFNMPTGELIIRNTNGFWYEFIKTIAVTIIIMCFVLLFSAILEYHLVRMYYM